METAILVIQVVIALGILNVWVLRYGKATGWRGGDAKNMEEEFAVYGLPAGSVKVRGSTPCFFRFVSWMRAKLLTTTATTP